MVVLYPRRFLSWLPLAVRVLSRNKRTDELITRMRGRQVSVRAAIEVTAPARRRPDRAGPRDPRRSASTASTERRIARTSRGNPITPQASAAPVQRNENTMPKCASRNAPIGPRRPNRSAAGSR